ncbi:MAG TPA: hypothetical protein VK171_03630 [Fimbriimonas sp.]|nr:hypothetical protein [Fimbriimonas sp.]
MKKCNFDLRLAFNICWLVGGEGEGTSPWALNGAIAAQSPRPPAGDLYHRRGAKGARRGGEILELVVFIEKRVLKKLLVKFDGVLDRVQKLPSRGM